MQNRLMIWIILILFGVAAMWRLASQPNFQLFGSLVSEVETEEKLVALTFDDGPIPGKTEQILSILAMQQVPATFFLIGKEVEAHPELVGKILSAGHQVGNHSYSHQRMIFKTPSFIASEIEKTDALLRLLGVTGDIYFRPPYGKKLAVLPWYLQQNQRTSVTWTLAPEDFPKVTRSVNDLVNFTVEQVTPGDIVLLHVMYDSREKSMQAVPDIIRQLKAKGYRFVTVSELIEAGKQKTAARLVSAYSGSVSVD